MTRPQKLTVEYFSHDTNASSGRTLFILQNKYGNDGYAFWFKLLELLGRTEGHYYAVNNPTEWEFLLALTHVSNDTAKSIIDTLVDLEAIDPILYKSCKVIWCQKFIDRLMVLYSRRDNKPQKPPITEVVDNNNPNDTELMQHDVYNNPQTKLNYTKLNYTKDIIVGSEEPTENHFNEIFDYWNLKKIITHQKQTDKITTKIKSARKSYSVEDIKKAIDNYSTVLSKPDLYFFTYKWTLSDFLQRGLEKFLDNAQPLTNFLKEKDYGGKSQPSGKGHSGLLGNKPNGAFSDIET